MPVRVSHAIVWMILRHGWQQYIVRVYRNQFARFGRELASLLSRMSFLTRSNFWLLLSANLGYSLGLRFSAIRPKGSDP